MYARHERPTHPVVRSIAEIQAYDKYFDAHKVRVARSAYFGMTSYMDHCVGRLLDTLEAAGLADDTRIVYTTDHGDNIGHRGLWGKSNMYQESASIPLIVAGPGVPEGHQVSTPVSLVDFHQTILEGAGLPLTDEEEHDMPGHSLFRIARGEEPQRIAFSEYHAASACTGFFMIRDGRWKFVYYVGYPPQLFDLESDPQETADLGQSPEHAAVRARCEAKLREIVDPEAASAQAFADQEALIEREGGIEAVLARGDFGYTPAPGEKPQFG
jgi:choline-sulfatase